MCSSEPSAWSYLMSACVSSHRLLDDRWFTAEVDRVIITPAIADESLRALLHAVFDVHVEYLESLAFDPPPGMHCGQTPRWASVFNKLHAWNPDVFPYDRVLMLDSELIVKDFAIYRGLFDLDGDYVGVSESPLIAPDRGHHKLPRTYGDYSTEYAHINAGLVLLTPSFGDFYRLRALMLGGWDFAMQRCPEMARRPQNWPMWCPEQELLTCYFAGRSSHMGPFSALFSLYDTVAHWSYDMYGHKIWSAPERHPVLAALYRDYIRAITRMYPAGLAEPHLLSFYQRVSDEQPAGMRTLDRLCVSFQCL